TGGGITENLPRVLPEGLSANINLNAWTLPDIFQWLQEQGNVTQADMLTTFNCGVGMIVCVAAEDEATTIATLNEHGEQAFTIGKIASTPNKKQVDYYTG
ncbi:MAG: phosphoribosylformylglycinamidine cyclo-ligase, partial [Thiotrichaceae bacterium]|nr:phosphoribosylformylglycinamidine cyclo-ligase [Thiotrichaceae bacterium]